MAITTTGIISIKEAAGAANSIDTVVTSTSSGSLVTLSTNSTQWTGSTRTSITADTDSSPYSMLEFSGYKHGSLWSTTGTIAKYEPGGKISVYYVLTLSDMSPDNAGGTFTQIRSYRSGAGMYMTWSGSLNTNWVSIRIGTSSSNYTTLTRTGDFAILGEGDLTAPCRNCCTCNHSKR